MLPLPQFTYDPETDTGELLDDFVWQTKLKNAAVKTPYASLTEKGRLVVFTGYRWDFGSGPAIDDIAMVAASLVHDVLCDLTEAGELPWRYRKKGDKELVRVLRKYGTPWWRCLYVYAAVRWWSLIKWRR